MIEHFGRKLVHGEDVLRLAGLPSNSLEAILLGRGIRPESISETRHVLDETGIPFSPEAMVEGTFAPNPRYPTPFPIGRYGNGQWPVYYAALAEDICAAEVAYHLGEDAVEGRYYAVVSCLFAGPVVNLTGKQDDYPDLVSSTEAGYPFCQQIANEARSAVDALYAPSARYPSGVCVPTFVRASLSQPLKLHMGRFIVNASGRLTFQRS